MRVNIGVLHNFAQKQKMTNLSRVSVAYASVYATNEFISELKNCLYELRWLELLIVLLIFLDLYLGLIDNVGKSGQEFHISRAGRRTVCKFLEYNAYLATCMVIGIGIAEPLEWCNHITAAAFGMLLAVVFEGDSIIEHYCSIHGINQKWSVKAFIVAYVKTKFSEIYANMEKPCTSQKEE